MVGRHYAPSGLWVDGTGVAQRHDAGHRISERLSLPAARSRQEVLSRVSGNTCRGRCGVYATPGEKPELERTLGALGTFHQRGMPIEADFVRGCLTTACRVGVSATLSSGESPKLRTDEVSEGLSHFSLRDQQRQRTPAGNRQALTRCVANR